VCDVLANILIICLPWCHISSSRRAPVAPLAPPLERRAPAINICRQMAQIQAQCQVASLQRSASLSRQSEPAGGTPACPWPGRALAGRAISVRPSPGASRSIKPPVNPSTSAPPGRRSISSGKWREKHSP
jgi:hypothetical protein